MSVQMIEQPKGLSFLVMFTYLITDLATININ